MYDEDSPQPMRGYMKNYTWTKRRLDGTTYYVETIPSIRRLHLKYTEIQIKKCTYWCECKRTTKIEFDLPVKPRKKTRKVENFQGLFVSTSNIIHELWLEQNTDWHNPGKGQLKIPKIMEA